MKGDEHQDVPTDVMRAVTAGRKIEAIKLLRAQTGIGLIEAKEVVDSLAGADARFAARHPAAPRNDTGVGRLVLVLLLLGACVAAYLWMQG